jgi:hypothetical protein
MALVRTQIALVLEPGEATIRIDDMPSSFDPTSLVVLNPEVELLGTHGLRTYQDAGSRGASLALDLSVSATVRGLDIAYLTGGFDWSASYNLVVDPNDRSARLSGYVHLGNQSGADVTEAEFQLLAGQINRGGGQAALYDAMEMRTVARQAAPAPVPNMQNEGFAGYRLYTLANPQSLANGESRRVRLFAQSTIEVARELRLVSDVNTYDRQVDPEPRGVAVRYRVPRTGGSELADTALPSGQVQVMQPDPAGRAQLLGIAGIPDSPAGQELVLHVGTAFDVVAEREQTSFTRESRNIRTSGWRIELRNTSDRDVMVEVVERVPGDWEILSSSHEPTQTNARTARFEIAVPAGGSAELTYEVQVKD